MTKPTDLCLVFTLSLDLATNHQNSQKRNYAGSNTGEAPREDK